MRCIPAKLEPRAGEAVMMTGDGSNTTINDETSSTRTIDDIAVSTTIDILNLLRQVNLFVRIPWSRWCIEWARDLY
jgi:hypothetical protein